jgi:XRE family transcriptional regulator, regulator of sulfur utilization
MDEINQRVAASVRRVRQAQKLTLEELAKRSGVSRAMLSQIESLKVNPTIAVVWRISAGLGVPFADLLGQDELAAVSVMRQRDAQYLYSQDRTFRTRPLVARVPGHPVELYEIWLAPRAAHAAEAHLEGSRELLTVLRGRISLDASGEQLDLAEGDAVLFAADGPHRYANPSARPFLGHSLILYQS